MSVGFRLDPPSAVGAAGQGPKPFWGESSGAAVVHAPEPPAVDRSPPAGHASERSRPERDGAPTTGPQPLVHGNVASRAHWSPTIHQDGDEADAMRVSLPAPTLTACVYTPGPGT